MLPSLPAGLKDACLRTIMETLLFLSLSLIPAAAEIIVVEQFDDPDEGIAGRTGGSFWDSGNIIAPVLDGTPSDWNDVLGAPLATVPSRNSQRWAKM